MWGFHPRHIPLTASLACLEAALRFGVDALSIDLPEITPGMAALLIVFFVLGFTFYAALFATVGATVKTEQEAQQAQLPVAMLLVVSISFLQSVISAPDGTLATGRVFFEEVIRENLDRSPLYSGVIEVFHRLSDP